VGLGGSGVRWTRESAMFAISDVLPLGIRSEIGGWVLATEPSGPPVALKPALNFADAMYAS
jgi:hypothetical protein